MTGPSGLHPDRYYVYDPRAARPPVYFSTVQGYGPSFYESYAEEGLVNEYVAVLKLRPLEALCQVTGSADNVGIGSDFDGGFGAESAPRELDTSRDLHRIGDELMRRGYGLSNVEKIMSANWLRILVHGLPR